MSNSLVVLANKVTLPEEKKEQVRRVVSKGGISYLSTDKEVAPFMLFLMGHSYESISKSTNYPYEVIVLTSGHYDWDEKLKMAKNEEGDIGLGMQKQITNMMLVATFVAAQKELAKLMSGEIEPEKSTLAVKGVGGLEKLMDLYKKLNGMVDSNGNAAPIVAQNVQINHYAAPEDPKKAEAKEKSRVEMLRELAKAGT